MAARSTTSPRGGAVLICAVAIAAVAAAFTSGCSRNPDPTHGWDEPPDYTAVVKYEASSPLEGTYKVVVRDHEVTSFALADPSEWTLSRARLVNGDSLSLRQIVGAYRSARADRESSESVVMGADGNPVSVTIDWDPTSPADNESWEILDLAID